MYFLLFLIVFISIIPENIYMKAVLISGSPRKNGNTEFLLHRCMENFKKADIETDLLCLSEMQIKPCKACGSCRKPENKGCIITDDDFSSILQSMIDSQIIITATPVYFGSATPDLMALLDRAGYVSRGNGNLLSRKVGGPITVARRAGQNFTYAQLLYWYMVNDMIVPGSSYWNIAFGKDKGDVENDKDGLTTADRFIENIIWLAEKLYN